MKTTYVLISIKGGTVTEVSVANADPARRYEAVLIDHDGRPDPEIIFSAVKRLSRLPSTVVEAGHEFGLELD